MNGAQCRVARVLLSITKTQLAALTGLSFKTINSIESSDLSAPKASVGRVRAVLVVLGAEFIEDSNGFGVRLRAGLQDLEVPGAPRSHESQIRPLIEIDPTHVERIDAAQSRAGRGFLDWTREQALSALAVGLSTLQDFENEKRMPSPEIAKKIIAGFLEAGVTFSRSNIDISVHLDVLKQRSLGDDRSVRRR